MKKLLIVLASALVLTACGSVGVGTGSGPTPSTNPGLNFDAAVSEKDHAATLRVGQRLEVVLHASNGMANWTQPRSSDESILAPAVNPAATAARGVTLAAFKAIAPGSVEITSNGSPVCPTGQACPMYLQVYSVKVTITP
jgi:phage tail protein X